MSGNKGNESLKKSLILLSERPEDKVFAEQVCKSTGLHLKTTAETEEAVQALSQDAHPVIFVDGSTEKLYTNFEESVGKTLGIFSEKVQPNAIHFLTDDEVSQAPFLAQSQILGNFVTRDPEDSIASGRHYGRIVKAATKGTPFDLSEVFQKDAKTQAIEIESVTHKQKTLEAVKAYLLAANWTPRTANRITSSVDELLMNAFYDAPLAAGLTSDATYPSLNLNEISKRANVTLRLAFDGVYFGVSVTDFYGSLDKGRLMKHIAKEFSKSEYKVKASSFNAGIGLSIVHQTGGSLLFMSQTNVKTEAMLFFKKTDKFKDFKRQFRFVSTQFYF